MREDLEQVAQQYKIVVRDLMKVYKRGTKDVIALRGLDFEVAHGEFISIVGPSGSGKSTLLRLLGALDRPTAGTILYDGHDVTQLDDDKSMWYRRQKVGFIWQTGNLVPSLTALKNVMLPMRLIGKAKSESEQRARTLLNQFGLGARLEHRPHQLSGGENQRVAICVSLGNNPEVLLADEITGELDSETSSMVMDMLRQVHREFQTTIIEVTHNPRVASYAQRMLRIRDGLIEGQKHTIYGDISEVDVKGRIVIPETIRRMAGISKRVVLSVTSEGLLVRPLSTEDEPEVSGISDAGANNT